MKTLRTLFLFALVVAAIAGGTVWWRRRRAGAAGPPLQLGLANGSARDLDDSDPAAAELRQLAADVRRTLAG